jgi:hypothetical protein
MSWQNDSGAEPEKSPKYERIVSEGLKGLSCCFLSHISLVMDISRARRHSPLSASPRRATWQVIPRWFVSSYIIMTTSCLLMVPA